MLINDTFTKERIVIHFANVGINSLFRLGKINYLNAKKPLEMHTHKDSIEICYLFSGKQTYLVNGKEYHIKGGDVFISFPNELHGTGLNVEEKSVLYYLIIDTKNNLEKFMGYRKREAIELANSLNSIKNRVFKGNIVLKNILDEVFTVYFSQKSFKKIRIQNLMSNFLIKIIEFSSIKSDYLSSEITDILDYIDLNITNEITITSLAKKSNLSLSRFKQKFKNEVGIPPGEYILRKKIDYSTYFLKYTNLNITDIAYYLSFSSSQYFSTVFKKFKAITPKEYRINSRKNKI